MQSGNELYTSHQGTISTTNIDGPAGLPHTRITVGRNSGALAIDPLAGRLYAAAENDQGVGLVAILDTGTARNPRTGAFPPPTLLDSVALPRGGQPDDLALDPATGSLFVGGNDSSISVLDTRSRKVTGPIPLKDSAGRSLDPLGLDVDTRNGRALIVSETRCWSIDTRSLEVIAEGAAAGGPVTVDSTTGHAFMTHETDRQVAVVDTRTCGAVASISLDGRGGQIAIDATAGLAYAALIGLGPNSPLAVIDTRRLTVTRSLPRPDAHCWGALTIDSLTGILYAGCDGSVRVIATR